jgi:hypothetical protein
MSPHAGLPNSVGFSFAAARYGQYGRAFSPDVALILDAATLLQAAGAEFPGGIVRLAQKAGEQTQI